MNASEETLLDAVTSALPPLLNAMDVLERAARHLHPPQLDEVLGAVQPFRQPVVQGVEVFSSLEWPEHLQRFSEAVLETAGHVEKAFAGLAAAPAHSNPIMAAYSALRYSARATEALYPVSVMLPPVSRFFLLESMQDDETLLEQLASADVSREAVGVFHVNNALEERGGFSLYVPEYYAGEALPLVFALHGGSGHGRSFLWQWLRAARSLGLMVLSPTSRDHTWSLMGDDVDGAALSSMFTYVTEHWNVQSDKVLLTGMSDGGTFSYVQGLQSDLPYTHLAPIAASFHPMLLEVADAERVRNLPVYLTHGALDWMFPVDIARSAHQALEAAGAEVVYREVEDLSHTYPTEENEAIGRWLLET